MQQVPEIVYRMEEQELTPFLPVDGQSLILIHPEQEKDNILNPFLSPFAPPHQLLHGTPTPQDNQQEIMSNQFQLKNSLI